MKKLYLLALLIVITSCTFSQITFQKTFGDTSKEELGFGAFEVNDGYVIYGATSQSSRGAFLLKTNYRGDTLWSKKYDLNDDIYAVWAEQTNSGGYILAAREYSNGSYRIIRTNSSGDTLWSRRLTFNEFDYRGAFQETHDGGFVFASTHYGGGLNFVEPYLIKFNASGNITWEKMYNVNLFNNTEESIYDVQQTSDGGYVMAGSTQTFGAGMKDFYLVRTDSAGVKLWQRAYGGPNTDICNVVRQTADSGFILAGQTKRTVTDTVEICIIKTTATGDTVWAKTYGGANNDIVRSIEQTADGGYIIAGNTASFGAGNFDGYVIKIDASGTIQWSKTFGGISDDDIWTATQTIDGGYLLAGSTYSFNGLAPDAYLIKLDSTGSSGCHQAIANTGSSSVSLELDSNSYYQFSSGNPIVSNLFVGIKGGFGTKTLCAQLCSASASMVSNATCFSACNGTATGTAAGITPFTYLWSPSGSSTATASNLCAGINTVVVTDSFGCSASAIVSIAQPTQLAANASLVNDAACSTCNDGSATVSGSGGTGTYSYSWNSVPMQNTAIATGLTPGSYICCITDINGCSVCDTITVSFASAIDKLSSESTFTIYPNPAKNQLFVESGGITITEVNIYNPTGVLVSQIKQLLNNYIDIRKLAAGVYIAEIKTKEASVKHRWVKM